MDALQEAFDEGFAAVKAYVDAERDALVARIEALEKRQPEKGEQGEPGEPGRDGRDGADGAPGRDGIDGKDGAPGEKGEKGEPGRDGKDGVGLADAVIDRDGNLVLTMTNGATKALGRVIGKDGAPGADGRDGAPGKDGRDGFQLEHFDATLMEDGRTIQLSFEQKDMIQHVEIGIPAMIYRGVFKEGREYEQGDTVTWGGSLWHCDVEKTAEKPDSAEKHWTLAAKRGRDGKAGKDGEIKAKQPVKVGA